MSDRFLNIRDQLFFTKSTGVKILENLITFLQNWHKKLFQENAENNEKYSITWSSILPTCAKRSLVENKHVARFSITPWKIKNIFIKHFHKSSFKISQSRSFRLSTYKRVPKHAILLVFSPSRHQNSSLKKNPCELCGSWKF